ncbi:hypothetical protein BU25DRAFT_22463 [Macroventuria anomochaeta]|uniref:Uncharacterized protein n=1 Tax=Macroventuria anomochaeta TaxID=301207 RepID=A0ACB6S5F8_9PLEO|nr:uncharacterized protein BU25DRAFT_22463 [Macroventuria anomochaeta]KAF2629475.1 hypothetical protein BU25DRAFT_22463 [Macroventuria anomochaeta]
MCSCTSMWHPSNSTVIVFTVNLRVKRTGPSRKYVWSSWRSGNVYYYCKVLTTEREQRYPISSRHLPPARGCVLSLLYIPWSTESQRERLRLEGAGTGSTDACAGSSFTLTVHAGQLQTQRLKKVAASTCTTFLADSVVIVVWRRCCQALICCGAHTRPCTLVSI